MKKFFIFAAAIALTLTSCGNKTQSNATEADSAVATENTDSASEQGAEAEAIDEAALSEESKTAIATLTSELTQAIANKDSKATSATLAKLQATYQKLVEQGKLDEAKAYGASIKKLVSENAESIKNVADGNVTIQQLVDGVNNLPTSAETTAEQAKAAIENAPAAVKAAAEATASKAVSDAKTAAQNKVNSEVQKATDKATAAKAKAESKVTETKQKAANKVNEAKQKANDAVNNAANKAIKDLLK